MEWLGLVEEKLDIIFSKNKIPIIVGGTGLYIKSAINGISKIPKVDKVVFEDCTKLFEKIGILEFRKLVEKVDKDFILCKLVKICQIGTKFQKKIKFIVLFFPFC